MFAARGAIAFFGTQEREFSKLDVVGSHPIARSPEKI
jgi:hypothetical protein